jgi:UDP-N-acetylmuramate dehydrogenase
MPAGNGSNILVSDSGMAGAVISLAAMDRIEIINEGNNEVSLFVEAGVPLQRLVNLARDQGYAGIEGLTGIPGSVGGAIWGNAGSFGYEIGMVIDSLAVLNSSNNITVIGRDALYFSYRNSTLPEGCIILSANIILKKGDIPGIKERTAGFIKQKAGKQPLSERSAGCVFRNPMTGVYAGKLIEDAHCKGMKIGDVEVSALHANFFINRGHGTAYDFLCLMDAVKERVLNSSGIELEPEIMIIGKK